MSALLGKQENEEYTRAVHQIVAWDTFIKTKAYDRRKIDSFSFITKIVDKALGRQSNDQPLRTNDVHVEDYKEVLNAMDVCKAIVFYSANMRYHQGKTMNFIRLISAMFAATPYYLYSYYHSHYTMNAASSLFRFFSAIITYAYLNKLLIIFYVAIFDMARQYRISRILHKMIRVTHLELTAAVDMEGTAEDSNSYNNFFSNMNKASLDVTLVDGPDVNIQNPLNTTFRSNSLEKTISSVITTKDRLRISKMIPVPRIDLGRADNVYSWLYCRLILQNFGFRVRYRINLFVAVILFFTMVLMLVILNEVIEKKQYESNNDDARAVKALVTNVNFVQSMIATAVFTVFAFLLIYFASIVNYEFSLHRGAISSYVVRNRSELYIGKSMNKLSEDEQHHLHEAVEALVVAQEAIEINNEANPYKIIGIVPEGGVMASMATVVAGFYSVVFNMMFPGGSDEDGLEGTF